MQPNLEKMQVANTIYICICIFISWTTHILQVLANTLLLLLVLLLLYGQVAKKCSASDSSSPPNEVASPCTAHEEAHWCTLDESGDAEDASILPGVGGKLTCHRLLSDPGCQCLNEEWIESKLNGL